ncbi:MAG: hypothetical protein R3Y43_02330 [Alphaproteobacteria bacterium]
MQTYYKIMGFLNSPEVLSLLFDNRFFLVLFVIVLSNLINSSYRSLYLSALINVPGTALHEMMHFFVGGALNAQPVRFSIFPKKDEYGNYVMGAVGFKNITFYNAIPSALAPLLLLPIGFFVNRYLLPVITPSFFNYIFYLLLQTVIIQNAMPSSTDFKVAFKNKFGVLLYMVLAGLIVSLII